MWINAFLAGSTGTPNLSSIWRSALEVWLACPTPNLHDFDLVDHALPSGRNLTKLTAHSLAGRILDRAKAAIRRWPS